MERSIIENNMAERTGNKKAGSKAGNNGRTNNQKNNSLNNTGTNQQRAAAANNTKKSSKSKKGLLGTIGTIVILAIYILLEVTDGGSEVTAENRIKTELVRVVDGDTIIVNYENENTRVRLIGINSPESVHEDESKNTQEGRDASDFLKEYLADVDTVWLEFDTEQQDQYERTLAYVWMNAEGTDVGEDMLNGIIVKNGYADARSYEPNVKYQDALEEVEQSR